MAPPPPQSRFLEGSMNDRASAAPPADFLGPDAETTAEYERQFAMDWKPPDLALAAGYDRDRAPAPVHRNSFASVRSSASVLAAARTTTPRAPRPAASGFFAQVRERLGLHRSQSSMDVVTTDGEVDADADVDDGGPAGGGFFVAPVFKHKRSESVGANILRKKASGSRHGLPREDADDDGTRLRRSATNTASGPVGGGAAAVPPLPCLDPTKRPSRDEITASYQSLLASGFFGTHAIQSTRFAPPGQHLHRQENAGMPSFAQRVVEQGETPPQGNRSVPPSPERPPPPPPPPSRAAPPPPPPPPPPPAAMDTDTAEGSSPEPTPAGIPASDTVVFRPAAPERSSSSTSSARGADATGPGTSLPPSVSSTRKFKSAHGPSLSFSSVPYSSTRPGAEPVMAQRPYRPPPVSIARFSIDAGRPRSLDVALTGHQRGVKRPFTSTNNDSQASFVTTGRTSYDYYDGYGHDGIGVATTTGPGGGGGGDDDDGEGRHESGARKLVKRLRKSASKLSIDLGRTISRQSSSSSRFDGGGGGGGDDLGGGLESPPSRTSTSSSLRESLHWRLGSARPGPDPGAADPQRSSVSSLGGISFFGGIGGVGGGIDSCLSLSTTNSSVDHAAAAAPRAPVRPAHEAGPAPSALPAIAASPPSSAERNRLKKREIRGRRLRRRESLRSSPAKPSPLKQPPMVSPAAAAERDDATTPTRGGAGGGGGGMGMGMGMDWQGSPTKLARGRSRSRSRPRRSDASIFLHAHAHPQARGGGDEEEPPRRQQQQQQQQQQFFSAGYNPAAGQDQGEGQGEDGGMEGVEFSFHFPGRTRPGGGGGGGGGYGPLAVVPDANRGIPSVPSIPGMFRKNGFGGSVRVVRGDLV